MENIEVSDDALESFWVLVADSNKARFLHGVSPRAELQEFHTLTNADARKRAGEINTDGPGSRRDGGEGHRSSMPSDPVEHAKQEFAGQVADWLEAQRVEGRFERLSIIAAPQFLGDLRNKMTNSLEATVLEEIDKNLTNQTVDEVRKALQKDNE